MRKAGIGLLAVLAAHCAAGGTREEIIDLLARMATALSEGNPAMFLDAFDRTMPGYAGLESHVFALLSQAQVASSVKLTEDEGDARHRLVELDWLLEIRSKQAAGPTERRQQTVRARLERRKKAWKIVLLEPISLFAPSTLRPGGAPR